MKRFLPPKLALCLMAAYAICGRAADQKPPETQPGTQTQPDGAQAAEQEKAIAMIKKLTGTVTQNMDLASKPVIGVEIFVQRMPARFGETPILPETTDENLSCIKAFKDIKSLRLYSTDITDAFMKNLDDLTKLQNLDLEGSRALTDTGLEHVKNLKELERLHVPSTSITGSGLAHVRGLPKLRIINVSYAPVDDAGIENLKNMTQLRELVLGNTKITQKAYEQLKASLPDCKINYGTAPRQDPGVGGSLLR